MRARRWAPPDASSSRPPPRASGPRRSASSPSGCAPGKTVYAAAWVDGIPVCVGGHQPVGDVTEVVGVATLPAYRRRGLGAAVTAALVADALERGVRTVFLSAADDDVARMYGSVGFRQVGSVGAASPVAATALPSGLRDEERVE